MTKEKQVVSDQHFVPQFYLRRFTNEDGLLERLVLPTATVLQTAKRPKVECYDEFFYAVKTGVQDEASQYVEDFWGQIEDFVSPHLDEVERQVVENEQVTEHSLSMLAHLASMLWMRTPHFRRMLEHNTSKFEKQLFQHRASNPDFSNYLIQTIGEKYPDLTYDEAEEIRNFILEGRYDIKFSNAAHIRLMVESFEGFRNLFYGAKWRFYIASGDSIFVTSTSPCIEVFPPKKDVFYGPTFFCRKHFFPLSPWVLVEAVSPFLPGKRAKRKRVTDEDVLDFNLQQANWSHIEDEPQYSRCYAPRKEELEELVKHHNLQKEIDSMTKIIKAFGGNTPTTG
jgi:hypothetical protein